MGCVDKYLWAAEDVFREGDTESLARNYTTEELIEMWNELQESYRGYRRECARSLDRSQDSIIRGQFQLAQLMIAGALKKRGAEIGEITGRFTDAEYEALDFFESMKILDGLGVDEIVEFIERMEGKVYEIVKKYYEKQWYLIDRVSEAQVRGDWNGLRLNLAKALAARFRSRRKKIEDAVIAYIRKRPLTLFMKELEEAIKKVSDAEQKRRAAEEIEKTVSRIVDELEARLSAGREPEAELEGRLAEMEQRLSQVFGEINRLRQELASEIEKARDEKAKAAYQAELEALARRVEKLQEKLQEAAMARQVLEAEKERLASKLQKIEGALRGEGEGRPVTAESAWAFEEALASRILAKARSGFLVYDPRSRSVKRIEGPKVERYELSPGSTPRGVGVRLVSYRGVIRRRPDIVLEAVTLHHFDEYKRDGFDARSVGLRELLDLISERASDTDAYTVLLVSSPTGFTEAAVKYVSGGEGLGYLSRNLTVYLLDPVSLEIYYNRVDEAAKRNLGLVKPETDEEAVNKVVEYVRSEEAYLKALEVPSAPALSAREIAKHLGVDQSIVSIALERLRREGLGKLIVDNGETYFVYKRPPA